MFAWIVRKLWGDLSPEEMKKFGMLSAICMFILGTYWLMRPIQRQSFLLRLLAHPTYLAQKSSHSLQLLLSQSLCTQNLLICTKSISFSTSSVVFMAPFLQLLHTCLCTQPSAQQTPLQRQTDSLDGSSILVLKALVH
jgi:hypothetical protein